MNLKTFAKLFSGSPFKPLLQHREQVLDALFHLNQQLHSLNSDQPFNAQSSEWIKAFPGQLEKLEHEILNRIHQPSITSQPRDVVINTLQIQNALAHEICRLSERLSYRPLNLPPELIVPVNVLARQFGQTIYQLRQGIDELEQLNVSGYRKQHNHSLQNLRRQLALCTDELRDTSQEIRHHACQFEHHIDPVDVALLFLILDGISDLALWMRSLIVNLQN
ncbi:hypothetical protein GZ77_22805 [Endozoicomonas montiporae]|uniref:Phosphate transport regulator n=2 Tax=Endozoicomonas montiporae TaxID=1027273 RepID=A0A081N0G5_9GAMM|nr:DUF47 family protein [Endozoicomonas montiporae]AMO54398.1 phosphate transport regulator [Endozoicomonas montiporae CL-33]KEQ11938.1 hypothetical protein GZ77_22805 [Endozoicomonas montiporae]